MTPQSYSNGTGSLQINSLWGDDSLLIRVVLCLLDVDKQYVLPAMCEEYPD